MAFEKMILKQNKNVHVKVILQFSGIIMCFQADKYHASYNTSLSFWLGIFFCTILIILCVVVTVGKTEEVTGTVVVKFEIAGTVK